jgi:hypothetical protein
MSLFSDVTFLNLRLGLQLATGVMGKETQRTEDQLMFASDAFILATRVQGRQKTKRNQPWVGDQGFHGREHQMWQSISLSLSRYWRLYGVFKIVIMSRRRVTLSKLLFCTVKIWIWLWCDVERRTYQSTDNTPSVQNAFIYIRKLYSKLGQMSWGYRRFSIAFLQGLWNACLMQDNCKRVTAWGPDYLMTFW